MDMQQLARTAQQLTHSSLLPLPSTSSLHLQPTSNLSCLNAHSITPSFIDHHHHISKHRRHRSSAIITYIQSARQHKHKHLSTMASQQLTRKDMEKKPTDQNVDQGRPQVTHFESVTVKDSAAQPTVVHRVVETIHGQPQHQHQQYKGPSLEATRESQTSHQSADTTVGVGRNRENTVTAKDIAMDTGKTTAEYAGKAAGVVKDAAVVAGYGATELASKTATGATESMESLNAGVAGIIEGTAAAAEKAIGLGDTVMEAGKKGAADIGEKAVAGKDVALDTGKTAVGKGVGVAKDATLVAGWSAEEGVRESMEGLNAGVARVIEGTAVAAETAAEKAIGLSGTAVDVGIKGARYIGEAIVRGKDTAMQTGKTTGHVAKETALAGGRRAAGLAGDTTVGVRESMEGLNAGVGGVLEGTAIATEIAGEKLVDVAKKGAGYVGETMVSGKDVTLKSGKTAAGYVSKATDVAKDATLAAGRGATVIASDMAEGLTTSMESLNVGVGGMIEGTASATEEVAQKTFDTGKISAGYVGEKVVAGKDVALETGKATSEYARKAAGVVKDATLVAGWSAAELAGDTAAGVTESMEHLEAGVAGVVERTALATEDVAQKTFHTAVDVGRQGATYIGEKAAAGKDVTLEAGRATAEYLGTGASVVKDATLVGGWGALELASDTTRGVSESMETVNAGVAGVVESAAVAAEAAAEKAMGLKDVAVDVGKRGASCIGEKSVAGKDITFEAGKTTGEYVGKAAEVAKDATLVAGWGAAELASGTAAGVTESMENLNAGVAGLVEGTASVTEDVAQKTFGTMVDTGRGAGYLGEKAVSGAREVGKTTGEYVGKAKGASGEGGQEFPAEGTKPKSNVVEKEEVTVDFDQRKKPDKKG